MPFPRKFHTELGKPLDFPFDVESRLAALSPKHSVKGMFTATVVKRLGEAEHQRLKPLLLAPPRGNYVAFSSYPVVDHQRLTIALARRLFPAVPITEALRRFERSAAERFAETTLGKVVVAALDSPGTGLMRVPEISHLVSHVGTISAERVQDGVKLSYREYSGFLDCAMVGSLEGAVMFFGYKPEIEVSLQSERDGDFVVRWR